MDGQVDKLLFSILRSALCGKQMTDGEKDLVSDQDLTQVWQIAQKHDLVHLVAMGLLENNLIQKEKRPMVQRHVFAAAYRYERQNRELLRLCDILEEAKIPFVPLKGSVLRDYYPEPWMRTSCDVDILVKEQDTPLVKVLLEEKGFTFQGKGRHDLRFRSAEAYVELHYTLIEDNTLGAPDRILPRVLLLSRHRPEGSQRREFRPGAGADHGARGAERSGKDYADQASDPALRSHGGVYSSGRCGSAGL